jgi:hypothetical protein
VLARGHQNVPVHRPHTRVVTYQADGTTVVTNPDGSKELWYRDRLLSRFTPDGRRY